MLLAVLMLAGSFTVVFSLGIFSAFAEEVSTEEGGDAEESQRGEVDYINDVFLTPEQKLKTMLLKVTKDGYELYIDDYSGEVAIKNTKTDPASYLLATKYIQTLEQMVSGKDNKTVYIPYEASNMLASLGTIKDIFNK